AVGGTNRQNPYELARSLEIVSRHIFNQLRMIDGKRKQHGMEWPSWQWQIKFRNFRAALIQPHRVTKCTYTCSEAGAGQPQPERQPEIPGAFRHVFLIYPAFHHQKSAL